MRSLYNDRLYRLQKVLGLLTENMGTENLEENMEEVYSIKLLKEYYY
jgi:hypothetical protein